MRLSAIVPSSKSSRKTVPIALIRRIAFGAILLASCLVATRISFHEFPMELLYGYGYVFGVADPRIAFFAFCLILPLGAAGMLHEPHSFERYRLIREVSYILLASYALWEMHLIIRDWWPLSGRGPL